jgi:ribosome-interacting GTPase 1
LGIPEKIKQIEEDLHRTQINKKTEHHIGLLRARLAKLKRELEEQTSRRGGSSSQGYDVRKSGDASVVLIGLPSVGKSTLLNRLTNAKSKVGAYQFTTLEVVPGMMEYMGARIQILDLPGIIEGASSGKGLGKRVLSVARSADLIMYVLDVFQPEARPLLERELRTIGLRIDESRPRIDIERTSSGGISVVQLVKLTKMTEKLVKEILQIYDINSARVILREDVTPDQLIDVLVGNRVYVKSITVMNKIDLVNAGFTNELQSKLKFDFLPVSAEGNLNIEALKQEIYRRLELIRIYMRPRGRQTDYSEPMILRNGATVAGVCDKVHRKMRDEFRYAQVWGRSVKFGGQKVGLDHRLMDEDIITLIAN